MKMMTLRVAALALAAFAGHAAADEGMWLLNKPPMTLLKGQYSFTPTPEWLEHQQKSAINFGGASGSFVSARGLVMTNHHVGSDAIADLSTAERNLMVTGFYAATPEQELKCPNMDLRVLMTIEDVTDRVNASVKPGMEPAAADAARRTAMAEIETQGKAASGLDCHVVTLYNGGRYHLYGSKRFTDVRLVFCPESQIAFFGGDTDNFEYPRYDLDCCFFRIYENGKPCQPQHNLRFSPRGGKEGELALVFGHPGRTQRLLTVDDLRFRRDVELPLRLRFNWRDEIKAQSFCARSAEHARIGGEDLSNIANGRKARTGQYAGLLDPVIFGAKVADETRLRQAVDANPEWKSKWGDAWDRVAAMAKGRRDWFVRYTLVGTPRMGTLFGHALDLVRLGAELKKPGGERLPEYREAELPQVYQSLESEAPIYDLLEVHRLREGLLKMAERLGADDPVVVALLAGKSPQARAEEIIRGTSIKSAATRKQLAADPDAVTKSDDPMLVLARAIDPPSRELRKRHQDEIEAVERDAYGRIAQARFAIDGEKTYPDATGTLRMSFGSIKGYSENGAAVPAFTTFDGLYKRWEERKGQGEFALPQRWLDAKKDLDLSVPFNFVCTADIIGGNSGSPVVNETGDVIGLIFDGNIHSLPGAFQYTDEQARAVAVDSRGLLEGLRKVYKADALVAELEAK